MSENNRVSGKRPKKRRFYGNQFSKLNTSNEISEANREINISNDLIEESTIESASKRKIKTECTNENSATSSGGYIIMDKSLLFSFLESNLLCQSCNSSIKVHDKRIHGLFGKISISCSSCNSVVKINNSKLIGKRRNIPEINRRIVYAMRSIGQGLEPLKTFCSIMDLYSPITQNPYDKINQTINEASKDVAVDSMKKAAKEEELLTKSSDITVSGDGSWKTRGHTSKIGVCSIIGAETGKVIDVEVLSSTCKGCETWKGPRVGKAFEDWFSEHSRNCLKNHSGSSGKMEVQGMLNIFGRSVSERGVRYTNYIGDGDAKTFASINASKPYADVTVSKIECVGHVQKRMGTRLRKLKHEYKSRKLSDGKGLSGRGRLTDAAINQLTVYYGNAIRQHPNSLADMRNAVWAVYFHTRSSDSEPLHSFCPKGAESWCKFNRAAANNTEKSFHHKETLPPAVMDVIKPVFKALSSPDLLKRCLGSRTQNPNESFNSVIWQVCPKTSGSGRIVAEIAAREATILFNDGRQGRLSVMRKLGIHPGMNAIIANFKSDIRRVKSAEQRVKQNTVEARRAKRRSNLRLSAKFMEEEGVMYEPGGF